MRKTLTSLVALGFAVGLSGPALAADVLAADPGAAEDQLAAAGFDDARILPEVEVAKVTAPDGTEFFVLGGLHAMPDPGLGMDQAADPLAEPADPDIAADPLAEPADPDVAADPLAEPAEPDIAADPLAEPDGPDIAADPLAEPDEPDVAADPLAEPDEPDVAAVGSLEEQLQEAGIADYQILTTAMVAEVMVGEGAGESFYVILGLDGQPEYGEGEAVE